jgi:hypothetical protein
MITVRNNANTEDIVLPAVDHVTGAEEAARFLWDTVFDQAKTHGGSVYLDTPNDRRGGGWAVRWDLGPVQWADAYVVCEGADTLGFVAQAENGNTVVFRDTD